jgi:hypothetical protein
LFLFFISFDFYSTKIVRRLRKLQKKNGKGQNGKIGGGGVGCEKVLVFSCFHWEVFLLIVQKVLGEQQSLSQGSASAVKIVS